jgi:hypothetical protein
MRIRYLPRLLLSGAAFFCSSANLRAETPAFRGVPNSRPAFQVSVAHPTKDKPQSKLWFAHGSWWAWLPTRDGSSVWRRTEKGWLRQSSLDRALFGLPGQADVWAGQDAVHAVLVGEKRLVVAGLKWDFASNGYVPASSPAQFITPEDPQAKGVIETATIARDGRGCWWIAYPWQRQMCVRVSLDREGTRWSDAHSVNEVPASKDDICAIVELPRGVGLIWSDQEHDAVCFRRHADDAEIGAWDPIEVVDRGDRTADDHLNAAVARDGTLYVATKNSVDRVGCPQLVLRVRSPQGRWRNYPYALRTAEWQPSRPIVLLGGDPPRLLLFHSLYRMDRPEPLQSVIGWQVSDPTRLDLSAAARTLIDAGTHINNVTGGKARLPLGQPWIVLASDKEGKVYEARID